MPTRLFHNYSDHLEYAHACSSPRSLVILFLREWASADYFGWDIRSWKGGLETWEVNGYTLIQILASALHAAGVDLLQFGRAEESLFATGMVDQDLRFWVFDRAYYSYKHVPFRLISFSNGPKPEDWQYWWLDEKDAMYVGEFWDMVENTEPEEPELPIPGTWVD
ncbi:hypothetical protein AJ80_06127 [Polytolypa hystricis UAMH7299]|uniref:Uncharacterized protein n=1 Tax=Polytolypa hystricis (strain UAMH7299) TaxID=1447883 RepID=A0A2B7XZT5_POLH7|nr:hypothetical protein AJ80_06127 [Polytolypa hystricis UAMH7299]